LTRTQPYRLAAVVALAILAAGTVYAVGRPTSYESTAVVALAPRGNIAAEDIPSLVGSFGNSATLGTYVELIMSKDTLQDAGSPPVTVEARAVPASRVINVSTVGDETAVRPALVSLLRAATLSQQDLGDVWELRVLQAAQAPVTSGPGRNVIIAGSVVLAAFGVVLLLVLLRHFGLLVEPPVIDPVQQRSWLPGAADDAAREGLSAGTELTVNEKSRSDDGAVAIDPEQVERYFRHYLSENERRLYAAAGRIEQQPGPAYTLSDIAAALDIEYTSAQSYHRSSGRAARRWKEDTGTEAPIRLVKVTHEWVPEENSMRTRYWLPTGVADTIANLD
jgi:hypothetical protein